jgi:RND family efflux transporter MFP subunit
LLQELAMTPAFFLLCELTLLAVVPLLSTGGTMSPRVTAVAVLLSTLTLAALGACARASAKSPNEGDATAIPVIARKVAPSARAWSTTSSGIVQAKTTVDVGFQVPGKVVMVGPDEGQTVRAGQVIAAVDPTDYRLTVEQAAAQSDRAARDRDRNRPLLDAGSIAAADMDHLEIGARQSAAAADLARKKLADTRLEAPISGIIAKRSIEVGATAAPGQPVFTIMELDFVRVRIGVPEGDVGHVTVGAPASVRIPALSASFNGRVSLIGVSADPTTRSYSVEITVPNPTHQLRAGMVAEATISTKQSVSALLVPATAVLHNEGITLVYTVDQTGTRVHERRVTTGAARGESLEITSGLTSGDRIVVAGQQRLREGALVQTMATGGADQ